jgi:hypothetical protein
MLSYNKLAHYPVRFVAMTGYTVQEFQALLPYFRVRFEAHVATSRLDGQVRIKRRYCSYQNSPLPTMADKLLFILVYLKQGNLQQNHAALFEMTQPKANVWLHLLHPILNQALADAAALPERRTIVQSVAADTVAVYFHDGTERPIPRPKDKEKQKLYYSGKKKRHTLKNIVVIDADGHILLLTLTCEGKKHDKKAADEAGYQLPEGSQLGQDTGFQGFVMAGVSLIQPTKKPRGKELTAAEKERNRLIAKIRVRVEHAIGGVKRYRIVKDTIRAWKNNFRDKVMETCCGLHNFRLRFRPWHYETISFKSV